MNTAAPTDSARPDNTPLDEVMLAMDIVDTLRHERSTVERELETDQRDEALVARIKQIYAGQGIEVTEDLVRKGVEALKQDRFTYVAPKPSFSLRLAGIYIDRWIWFRRSAISLALLTGGWVAWQLPTQIQQRRAWSTYTERVGDISEQQAELESHLARLSRWQASRGEAADIVRVPINTRLGEINATVERVRALAADRADKTVLDADTFARTADASHLQLAERSRILAESEILLTAADAKSQDIELLDGLAARHAAVAALLDPAELNDSDRDRISAARTLAEAALRVGNTQIAEPALERLELAADQLTQAYELRIASGEGVRSGIWRYPVDNPDGRNYYLVVEAISEFGLPLALPISNEETQKIETVTRYAVRVPESVYEAVKADKLDNGLIDDAIVGSKRRGTLDVDFKMPVAGGYITRWEQ